MEKFCVTLPLTGEYLTTVRLTTGGLCSLVGFDVDATEDFKVCVTECLLILNRNGFAAATISLTLGRELACEITGEQLKGDIIDTPENDISLALLSALLGSVEFVNEGNRVVKINFKG